MLVVIGDLVADIIVLGGDGGLARATDNPAEVRLTRGGSAANVAVAAAPRHPVRFVGRVGDDTIARALVGEMTDAGVDVRVQHAGRTGTIIVLVDASGERTMITDRAAAAELEAIDPAWLDGATWLHLPLYGFSEPAERAVMTAAVAWAHAQGVPVSIDLSSTATMRALGASTLAAILSDTAPDVLFANRDEAELAQEMVPDAAAAVRVTKRGGDPVLVRDASGEVEVPVERIDAVLDSTGAGDAFAAGYLTAALEGASPVESARAGGALALSALQRAGAL